MTMRLQEVHPSLVHFPIALLPVAVGADLVGHVTGNESLMQMGRRLMPVAAGSAAVAAVFGLVAQEEVRAEGPAHDALVTHRNLNLGLVGLSAAMAAWRARRERPTAAYLALGLAGLGVMNYTAYLGGHMVYEHGVGVKAAGGLAGGDAPELTPGTVGEAARAALADVRDGAAHAAAEIRDGELAPSLARDPSGGSIDHDVEAGASPA